MSGNTPEWVKYAKPGDPLVCLRTHTGEKSGKTVFKGRVYTFHSSFLSDERTTVLIAVKEVLTRLPSGEVRGWNNIIFRPADTTDLPESLTEILTRTNPVQWKENENV